MVKPGQTVSGGDMYSFSSQAPVCTTSGQAHTSGKHLGHGHGLKVASGQPASCPGGWAWSNLVKHVYHIVFDLGPAGGHVSSRLDQQDLGSTTWKLPKCGA